MSSKSSKKIDKKYIAKIIQEWYIAKKKISQYEKVIEEYKKTVNDIMDQYEIDTIRSGDLSITRRHNTRRSVSQKTLPSHIWEEYSVRSHYDSFHLSKTS